jgi:hypothetical protein
VVAHHNRSVAQALIDLFPNLEIDKTKFEHASNLNSFSFYLFSFFFSFSLSTCNFEHTEIWQTAENRRKFFEEYAREKGFDPLIADNWYQQSIKDVVAKKVKIFCLFLFLFFFSFLFLFLFLSFSFFLFFF